MTRNANASSDVIQDITNLPDGTAYMKNWTCSLMILRRVIGALPEFDRTILPIFGVIKR